MTGLETAIILIAFVTVSSVLAYSVLSAGIYAAEKGKETVSKGLEHAQSSMQVRGAILGLSPNGTKLEQVQFNIGVAIANATVDASGIVVNYFDDDTHVEGMSRTITLASGSTERGAAGVIEQDEQFTVTITFPGGFNLTAHKAFTLQLIPPTGAAITIAKAVPSPVTSIMQLQ
jgi:archaellin